MNCSRLSRTEPAELGSKPRSLGFLRLIYHLKKNKVQDGRRGKGEYILNGDSNWEAAIICFLRLHYASETITLWMHPRHPLSWKPLWTRLLCAESGSFLRVGSSHWPLRQDQWKKLVRVDIDAPSKASQSYIISPVLVGCLSSLNYDLVHSTEPGKCDPLEEFWYQMQTYWEGKKWVMRIFESIIKDLSGTNEVRALKFPGRVSERQMYFFTLFFLLRVTLQQSLPHSWDSWVWERWNKLPKWDTDPRSHSDILPLAQSSKLDCYPCHTLGIYAAFAFFCVKTSECTTPFSFLPPRAPPLECSLYSTTLFSGPLALFAWMHMLM